MPLNHIAFSMPKRAYSTVTKCLTASLVINRDGIQLYFP